MNVFNAIWISINLCWTPVIGGSASLIPLLLDTHESQIQQWTTMASSPKVSRNTYRLCNKFVELVAKPSVARTPSPLQQGRGDLAKPYTPGFATAFVEYTKYLLRKAVEKHKTSYDEKIFQQQIEEFNRFLNAEQMGPFCYTNESIGEIIVDVMGRINGRLKGNCEFGLSGIVDSDNILLQTLPRCINVPRMSISSILPYIANETGCTMEMRNSFVKVVQHEMPNGTVVHIFSNPVAIEKGKPKSRGFIPLGTSNAMRLKRYIDATTNIFISCIACDSFVIFESGQKIGIIADQINNEILGFDCGKDGHADGVPWNVTRNVKLLVDEGARKALYNVIFPDKMSLNDEEMK